MYNQNYIYKFNNPSTYPNDVSDLNALPVKMTRWLKSDWSGANLLSQISRNITYPDVPDASRVAKLLSRV